MPSRFDPFELAARRIAYLELRPMDPALERERRIAAVARLRLGAPLNEPDPKTYDGAGATGCTDRPRLDAAATTAA